MTLSKKIVSLLLLGTLVGCASLKGGETHYPKSAEDQRREKRGRLTGEGLTLFGGNDENGSGGGAQIGVNSYLWRATLDTLSFLPLASADPFGGVIITDWYEDANVKNERFKLNVRILDTKLRADGVRVSVFKQERSTAKENWRDAKVAPTLAENLENKILTRARELRLNQSP